jgi:hypothetical protein
MRFITKMGIEIRPSRVVFKNVTRCRVITRNEMTFDSESPIEEEKHGWPITLSHEDQRLLGS